MVFCIATKPEICYNLLTELGRAGITARGKSRRDPQAAITSRGTVRLEGKKAPIIPIID